MTFGISTHLFHGQRLDRRHLEALTSHGFDLLEVFATRTHFDYRDHARVAELQGWLRDLGMSVNSIHAPICDGFRDGQWGRAFSNASSQGARRQEAIDETKAAMDAARELGAAFTVLHLGLPRGQTIPPGDNDPGAMRRSLEAIAQAAADSGVRLALEVIPNELSTPAALADLLNGDLELGDAGICLDFGHAHMMIGAEEAAETLAGHLVTTHVHDNNGRSDDHLVPFAGSINWAGVLMAMQKVGYTGPFMFEVADHGDASGVLTRTIDARQRLQAIIGDGLDFHSFVDPGDR
jgi:sugar phosphate isomerase/epimerase